jgi:succinate dehydrogenase/fumarate reductase-like Fe-S protein
VERAEIDPLRLKRRELLEICLGQIKAIICGRPVNGESRLPCAVELDGYNACRETIQPLDKTN